MKRRAVLFSLLALLLMSAGCPQRANPSQTVVGQLRRATLPEMDLLIQAIHSDLMKLRTTVPWLADYGPDNLLLCRQDHVISYGGPIAIRDEGKFIQVHDHIRIEPLPLSYDYSHELGGTRSDDFFNIPECRFPEVNVRLEGSLVIRGEGRDEAKKAVEAVAVKRCAEWHRKLAGPTNGHAKEP